jgi:hypothetical protein
MAHRAFMAVWNRRTDQDLVGNQIEIQQGRWLPPGVSGIHAGIDSFFEYALKAAIMLGELQALYPETEADNQTTRHTWTSSTTRMPLSKRMCGQTTVSSYVDNSSRTG